MLKVESDRTESKSRKSKQAESKMQKTNGR